jgi:hypothetical protein
MKDNSVLSQFTSRVAPVPPKNDSEPEPDTGGEENFGAFGWLRGIRDRAVMLEFRCRDGSVVALNYSWLERIDFDSAAITLKFGGQSVRVVGRNLDAYARPNVRLLDLLCRHRVLWVQESDLPGLRRADRNATVIEHIEIE